MISLMADRSRHGTVPAMRIPEPTIPAPSAQARVRDAYDTARYQRLAKVKAAYDPTNLLRLNHNVEPAA